jgi:aromatic-L-amino-acid decarboxylase
LDELNARIMDAANATGEIFISHTKIDGKFALRLAIGNLRTTRDDVERAWAILREQSATVS